MMRWYLYFLNVEEKCCDEKKDERQRQPVNIWTVKGLLRVMFSDCSGLVDPCWPGWAELTSCQAVSGHVRPQSKLCKSEAGGDCWDYRPDWCSDWKHTRPPPPPPANTENSENSENSENNKPSSTCYLAKYKYHSSSQYSQCDGAWWEERIFQQACQSAPSKFCSVDNDRDILATFMPANYIFKRNMKKSWKEDILFEFGCALLRWWPLR